MMEIGRYKVGPDHPPLIIAELGINHNGNLDVAIALADLAIKSGAHVIKHQTHVVDDEMTYHAKHVIPGNSDISIYEIMESCALDENAERALMQHVETSGCVFISTPFSRAAADRLQRFDVSAFKIGSGECNNYPLIKHVARFGKPMIVSTGMNDIDSLKPTVEILRSHKIPFALLHCTNVYPTPPELVRLKAIQELAEAFPDAIVGLSDHSTSNHCCFGAVALGACILERHFTDTMLREGPDIVCSMDPEALKDLRDGSERLHAAARGGKGPVDEERVTMNFAFASVVADENIEEGEALTESNIWLRRPGTGDFGPSDYDSLIGRRAARRILKGSQLSFLDLCPQI